MAIDLAHPEPTEQILKKAYALSQVEETKLAVITAIPDFGMSIVNSYFKERTHAAVARQANDSLHKCVKTVLGESAKVKHIVKQASAYEEILETANEIGTTLIVMGAHRPGFRDYLLGPNAVRVVRHAQASVYVIRD